MLCALTLIGRAEEPFHLGRIGVVRFVPLSADTLLRVGVVRPGVFVFVTLSLVGSLAFSVPLALVLATRRKKD